MSGSLVGCLTGLLVAAAVLAWPCPSSRRRLLAVLAVVSPSSTPSRPGARARLRRLLVRRAARRASLVAPGPDLLMDLVASGLRSGLSVVDALACASAVGGDPSAYIPAVVARLRVGLPAQLAWDRPPPPLLPLARAMILADLSGAPAAAVVARAADDARALTRERVELAAARLGVRLVLPLGLAVLPGFVLLAVVPIVLGLAASVLQQAG